METLKNDVPRIRFHDLRHTHATHLLLANVNPKVVSERLGHSSIAVTLDIYSHLIPTMQSDAAGIVQQQLFGKKSLIHKPDPKAA